MSKQDHDRDDLLEARIGSRMAGLSQQAVAQSRAHRKIVTHQFFRMQAMQDRPVLLSKNKLLVLGESRHHCGDAESDDAR